MKPNRMKAQIKSGKPAFGVSVMFPAPELVEMIGELGFDWVMLDAEHGSITPDNITPMILAAEVRGVTPIVRPERNDAALINRYLDRGAMGVQVPHVNTRAEAQAAVKACRYWPEGGRGLAGGRMADFGYGAPTTDFVKRSNAETLVCIQIEDIAAVNNLDDILATPGVDVFFVGPTDLAQSMGHPGENNHPDVQKTVADVFKRIHAAGRASGTPGNAEACARNAANGVLYHYTHIPTFMSYYGKHFMKAVGRS
jgi:4-hydroxy-2-oxoheptanedioate aldolase